MNATFVQSFAVLPNRPPSVGTTSVYQYTVQRGTSESTTNVAPIAAPQRGTSLSPTAIMPVTASQQGNSAGTTSTPKIRWEGGNSPSTTGESHIPYDTGLTTVQNTVREQSFQANQGPSVMVGIRAQQRSDMNMAKAQTTKPRKPSLDLTRNMERFAEATTRKNFSRGSFGVHAEGRRGTPLTNFTVNQALRSYATIQGF